MSTKLEEKKHNNTIEQIAICVAFCVLINSHVAIAPRNNIDFYPISLSHTKSHIENAEVGKREGECLGGHGIFYRVGDES